MSETKERPQDPQNLFSNVSFSIWPPSQRTRDAVTNRLLKTLSLPSVVSVIYIKIEKLRSDSMKQHSLASGFSCAKALQSTPDSIKPIFVSVGHCVSLATAIDIVKISCKYRVPEPIRQVFTAFLTVERVTHQPVPSQG